MSQSFWLRTARYFLEFFAMIPGVILCYLPMDGHLRGKEKKILVMGVVLLPLWAFAGGGICAAGGIPKALWAFPWMLVFVVLYCRMVDFSAWKCIGMFLSVCAVFTCVTNVAILADALIAPDNSPALFSLPGAALHNLFSWGIMALLAYPATHGVRWLFNEIEMPRTWYVFWLFPAVFAGLNSQLRPRYYSTLYTNRVMGFYPILCLAFLLFYLFFYLLLYLAARGISENSRLLRENEMLQLQTAQYRSLKHSMEETRIARHDLHQHFAALSGIAAAGDIKAVSEYLESYGKNLIPERVFIYCKNQAVNAVLGYYAGKAEKSGITMNVSVRMGENTVIPEAELCVLLGNLLENAVDACTDGPVEGNIQVRMLQSGSSVLSLAVDNPCPRPPAWFESKLRSAKHAGFGMGTQSVKNIAARHHGDARFQWKDGVFYASVMLNPE